MTNGEKIKELFPHFDVEDKTEYFGRIRNLDDHFIKADIDFWNAEYKEPTTKNDLGVENDLVSSIVEKISEKVTETREEFIFETIRPYCENVVQMKISKRELEQALLKYYGKNDLAVDCVKKSDAINIIQDMHGLARADVISDAVNKIIELPSVTPQEPKTGHWIEGEIWEDTDGGWGRWQKCSVCRESEHHKKNFCPNCGAKMEEG